MKAIKMTQTEFPYCVVPDDILMPLRPAWLRLQLRKRVTGSVAYKGQDIHVLLCAIFMGWLLI